ncbi:MAG TPA: hydrolase [Terriglobales bacterium]|nr:hydrolase [Terriglobales bacterium]
MATRLVGSAIPAEDASEAARQLLRSDSCALVVVDMQEKLFPPIFEKERLARNVQLLIRLAKILQLPILAATQHVKGLGPIIPEIASLLEGTQPINKMDFSCLSNPEFCAAVKHLPRERNTLLLCGMEAHICITQTALGALNQGYIVHVAADAVSSRSESNWKIGLERMKQAGVVISSTEMMMYELMRASGTPVFKEMLQHLK